MKINIVAVGKIKERYLKEAVDEYVKRISRYADVCVAECPEAPSAKSPAEQVRAESEKIKERLRGCVVALDIGGKNVSSPEFASFIDGRCSAGVSEFTFVIGGSHGIDSEILALADARISFGRMTFPHQLFRVMLAEQIYRAVSIINNTPYHK